MKPNRVLITGADSGIGLAIRKEFAKHCTVADNFSRHYILNGTAGGQLAKRMAFGTFRYDTVIFNFGYNHLSWIGFTDVSDADIFRYNVLLPYFMVNDIKRAADVGRIEMPKQFIFLSSSAATTPMRCSTLYCSSKAAVDMMIRCMNRELQPNTRVLGVAPGMVKGTEMYYKVNEQVGRLRGWDEEQMHGYAKSLIPAKRYTTPEEVAEFVWQVANSPDYVSGCTMKIQGGL